MSARFTQEDVDRLNAQRGEKLPAHLPPAKASKYRNVRTRIGDEVFDSKREANRWMVLKAREAQGEITDLRRQVRYPLYAPIDDPETDYGLAQVQVSEYVADFTYRDRIDHKDHVEDSKGHRTREYALKKKWLELQSGIVIEEV